MLKFLRGYGLLFGYLLFVGCIGLNLRDSILFEANSEQEIACKIALSFVLMTVPISFYQLFQNLANFIEPSIQTHIVRIIWLVPVYAVQSWLSIQFYQYSVLCQTIRECYESYTLYCFFRLLVEYFGSEKHLQESLNVNCGRHMPPCCCMSSWKADSEFIPLCKLGIFQYVVLRFSTALITLLAWCFGSPTIVSAYINLSMTAINVFSQSWALYILLLFYHATVKELAEFNPLGKFICIKSVVFFSWWQSILIGLLVWWHESVDIKDLGTQGLTATRILNHDGTLSFFRNLQVSEESLSIHQMSDNVQDLLICTEMLVAAIAFLYAFPISEVTMIHNKSVSSLEDDQSSSLQVDSEGSHESSSISSEEQGVNVGCSCHCSTRTCDANSNPHDAHGASVNRASKITMFQAIMIVTCLQTELLRDMAATSRTIVQFYCTRRVDQPSIISASSPPLRWQRRDKAQD